MNTYSPKRCNLALFFQIALTAGIAETAENMDTVFSSAYKAFSAVKHQFGFVFTDELLTSEAAGHTERRMSI